MLQPVANWEINFYIVIETSFRPVFVLFNWVHPLLDGFGKYFWECWASGYPGSEIRAGQFGTSDEKVIILSSHLQLPTNNSITLSLCFLNTTSAAPLPPRFETRRLFTSHWTNQEVKLSPAAVQTSHIQRGEFSNPGADTPSLHSLLPRTECALHHSPDIICCRLRLLRHLMKKQHRYSGSHLLQRQLDSEKLHCSANEHWFLRGFLQHFKYII